MSPKVSRAYKETKKRELLKAAKQVFIRKGFIRTSMQDIMDEARVSRGAFYGYFDNIDHVFIEVIQYDDQQNIQFFEPTNEESLWTQMKHWINIQQFNIEAADQTLLHAKAEFFLSSKYMKNKKNFPYIAERYDQTADAIENVINNGIESKEFRPCLPPAFIARHMISFINGLMLDTFQLGTEKTKVKEQLSVFLFSLEKMICPVEQK